MVKYFSYLCFITGGIHQTWKVICSFACGCKASVFYLHYAESKKLDAFVADKDFVLLSWHTRGIKTKKGCMETGKSLCHLSKSICRRVCLCSCLYFKISTSLSHEIEFGQRLGSLLLLE